MRRSRRHAAEPGADRGGRLLLSVLAGLLLAGLLVAAVAWSADSDEPDGPSTPAAEPRPAADSTPGRASSGATRRRDRPAAGSRVPDRAPWEHVLTRLLARRAAAYAAGAPARLATVYVPGSGVLRRDSAVLQAWVRRGFSVEGATVRVRSAELVRRGPRSVVLRTVDRLDRPRAVGAAGGTRWLPRDRFSAHRIALVHTVDGWRIATIRARSG